MKGEREYTLARGFETWEKIYAQLSFIAIGTIGTVGVALVDWRWALVYALIYLYGIMGVVMRHLVCPRCPHLHEYHDCLQAPARLTRWLVRERKTAPLSTFEKLLFYTYFIFVPVFPVYWLLTNRLLLVAFLAAVGMWYLGQFFHFCRRCRVKQCPFNRAKPALWAGRTRRLTQR
jgi:MFS family permease